MIKTFMLIFLATLATRGVLGEEVISFRTLCTGYSGKAKSLYLRPSEKGTVVELPLYTDIHSLSQDLSGVKRGGRVVFLPSPDAAAAGGIEATVPDSGKVLFIFVPAAEGSKVPYRVVALPDDYGNFPLHRVKAINLSPADLQFELGEFSGASAVALAPGKTLVMGPVRKVNHLNAYDAKLSMRRPDGSFASIYNSRWRSVAAKRDLVIVFPDAAGRLEVRLFEDAEPAEVPDSR